MCSKDKEFVFYIQDIDFIIVKNVICSCESLS